MHEVHPKGEYRPEPIRINRTTDTRIFSLSAGCLWLYLSVSYRGVRCLVCITVHNDAQLIHANLTHSRRAISSNMQLLRREIFLIILVSSFLYRGKLYRKNGFCPLMMETVQMAAEKTS